MCFHFLSPTFHFFLPKRQQFGFREQVWDISETCSRAPGTTANVSKDKHILWDQNCFCKVLPWCSFFHSHFQVIPSFLVVKSKHTKQDVLNVNETSHEYVEWRYPLLSVLHRRNTRALVKTQTYSLSICFPQKFSLYRSLYFPSHLMSSYNYTETWGLLTQVCTRDRKRGDNSEQKQTHVAKSSDDQSTYPGSRIQRWPIYVPR